MINLADLDPNTPILVGAGQHSEQLSDASYAGLSPVGLAAAAANEALSDAVDAGTPAVEVAASIDAVYAIRTVGDTGPRPTRAQRAPFGAAENFPESVAQRIGSSVVDFGARVGERRAIGSSNQGDGKGLSGYIVVEAPDLDAAVELAAGCPNLTRGGGVEIGAIVTE